MTTTTDLEEVECFIENNLLNIKVDYSTTRDVLSELNSRIEGLKSSLESLRTENGVNDLRELILKTNQKIEDFEEKMAGVTVDCHNVAGSVQSKSDEFSDKSHLYVSKDEFLKLLQDIDLIRSSMQSNSTVSMSEDGAPSQTQQGGIDGINANIDVLMNRLDEIEKKVSSIPDNGFDELLERINSKCSEFTQLNASFEDKFSGIKDNLTSVKDDIKQSIYDELLPLIQARGSQSDGANESVRNGSDVGTDDHGYESRIKTCEDDIQFLKDRINELSEALKIHSPCRSDSNVQCEFYDVASQTDHWAPDLSGQSLLESYGVTQKAPVPNQAARSVENLAARHSKRGASHNTDESPTAEGESYKVSSQRKNVSGGYRQPIQTLINRPALPHLPAPVSEDESYIKTSPVKSRGALGPNSTMVNNRTNPSGNARTDAQDGSITRTPNSLTRKQLGESSTGHMTIGSQTYEELERLVREIIASLAGIQERITDLDTRIAENGRAIVNIEQRSKDDTGGDPYPLEELKEALEEQTKKMKRIEEMCIKSILENHAKAVKASDRGVRGHSADHGPFEDNSSLYVRKDELGDFANEVAKILSGMDTTAGSQYGYKCLLCGKPTSHVYGMITDSDVARLIGTPTASTVSKVGENSYVLNYSSSFSLNKGLSKRQATSSYAKSHKQKDETVPDIKPPPQSVSTPSQLVPEVE